MKMTKAVPARRMSEEDAIRDLEKSQVSEIERAIPITGQGKSAPPISIRLSPPLLRRLEEIAREEHRTRGNLIQRVLWEFVLARETVER